MYGILKSGEISDVNRANGTARVILLGDDEKTTSWLPLLVPYSESHSFQYSLKVGQTVFCLFFGDYTEEGVILGCPMRAGVNGENEIIQKFNDGNSWNYNNGTLTLNIPNVIINGNLTVTGETITGGSINLNTHTHSNVTSGTDKTGGPQ